MYKWRSSTKVGRRFLSGIPEPKLEGYLVEPGSGPHAKLDPDGFPEPMFPSGPESRFDPRTLVARKPIEKMVEFPPHLSAKISEMTEPWEPQLIRQQASKFYQQLASGAPHAPALESIEVEAHITGLFLQNYATLKSVLLETQKRMPQDWTPKSVLEVGFGPLPGMLVTRSMWPETEFEREVGVVLGHPRMKRRAKELLAAQASRPLEKETVVLRDKVPNANSPGRYDLIIASHQIYQGDKHAMAIGDSHAKQLAALLSPGGVLVIVERGSPLGFEAVARARESYLRSEDMEVLAPCSHRLKCPLQMGMAERRDNREKNALSWCRFTQNVARPKWAIELKKGQYLAQKWDPELSTTEFGAKGPGGIALSGSGRPGGNANEIASYSYLVVRYKSDFKPEGLPRILVQPVKQTKRVTMAVCAPDGNIEKWTVPKSQGKQAYHDARKAREGDLWALDAKTKLKVTPRRNPRKIKTKQVAAGEGVHLSGDWWTAPEPKPVEGADLGLEESLKLIAKEEERKASPRLNKLERMKRQRIYDNFNEGD